MELLIGGNEILLEGIVGDFPDDDIYTNLYYRSKEQHLVRSDVIFNMVML